MNAKPKVLFIDRDGTILREPEDEQIDSLSKFHFVPGAIGAKSPFIASCTVRCSRVKKPSTSMGPRGR